MFNMLNRSRILRGLCLLALLYVGAGSNIPAQQYEDNDDRPDPGTTARVRFIEGRVGIESSGGDVDEATINSPVFPGDEIRTDDSSLTEVQLADGSMVRMGENTTVEFRSLPDPYGRVDDPPLLRLYSGSIYLDVRGEDRSGNTLLQVDTPTASAYVQSAGVFRLDVEDNDPASVQVSSRRGAVEVYGEGGSVLLRAGQRTIIDDGQRPSRPVSFSSTRHDSFDRWNEDRIATTTRALRGGPPRGSRPTNDDDSYYDDENYDDSGHYDDYDSDRGEVDYERIPDEVRPYAGELSAYGHWAAVPEYGYVWSPAGVASSWTPYNSGRWVFGPYGWYWASYDPWGWAPYHYGRWCHSTSIGWVWVPGHVFSGAWVSWYYGPSYVGWCPLDYYDRPAFVSISFHVGGWGYDPRCWNFVPYNQIVVRNVQKVVIRQVAMPELTRGVIVRKAVPINPAVLRAEGGKTRLLERVRHAADIERASFPGTRASLGDPSGRKAVRGDLGSRLRSFHDTEGSALTKISKGDFKRGPAAVLDAQNSGRRGHDFRPAKAQGSNRGLPSFPKTTGSVGSADRSEPLKRRSEGDSRPSDTRVKTAGPKTLGPANRGPSTSARPALPDRSDRDKGERRSLPQFGPGAKSARPDGDQIKRGPAREPKTFPPQGGARDRDRDGARLADPPRAESSDERLRRLFRDADRPRGAHGQRPARDENQPAERSPRRADPREFRRPEIPQEASPRPPEERPLRESGPWDREIAPRGGPPRSRSDQQERPQLRPDRPPQRAMPRNDGPRRPQTPPRPPGGGQAPKAKNQDGKGKKD